MPHTISPNPSSQGLGISFSTLSPPPAEPQLPRFTGIVPKPSQSSPSRLPLASQLGSRPQPSPTRGAPAPAFQLRPTHTRQGSSSNKGFTSFSAIPPSPARPMGPRSVGVHSPRIGGPSIRSESENSHNVTLDSAIDPQYADEEEAESEPEEAESQHGMEDETPKQSLRPLPTPTRSASIASHLTTASRQISEDMRRKFSKSSGADTFGGGGGGSGKYLPLSGEDDLVHENEQEEVSNYVHGRNMANEPSSTNVEASPMDLPVPHPRRPSTSISNGSAPSGSRSESIAASPSKLSSQSHQSSGSHSTYQTRQFPYPPTNIHPPRSATTYSDPTNGNNHAYHQYQAYSQEYLPPQNRQQMSRSKSQPQYLYGVPEVDDMTDRPQHRKDPPMMAKRTSDISSGIHSKNAVLLSAENGGMMLAFSPTGDGTFRPGETICGSGTGLLPSAQSPASIVNQHRDRASSEEDLRARPWSESSMSHENGLARKPTMLGNRGRSLSDGAQLLARQGTLLHPSSSKQRSSAELNVLLGGPKSRRLSTNKLLPPPPTEQDDRETSWQKDNKVRLEASKKGKARVEVDVVLERECVVEGGEVRGRMEVKITGGKRGEGLRVGGGKVRVVGFEELSATTRHIFYHQPHPLPVFDPDIQHNLSSSLFASGPDSDGYRLAAEGTHNIPFRMRLPLGGGAKGTYTSQNGKGPCVRYVVVGSVKIHIPSTGKRSIAHFYRSIVVLPYLNPSLVLAPSTEPVEGYTERGLGWNLTGEKGRVELRVSLGRRIWVSGQRLWCEVAIRNDSNKKIKTLNLALLQTIQVFNTQPLLDTSDLTTKLIKKRKSLPNCVGEGVPGTPDLDACQTTTQRRKISEEIIEADFISHGAGRVTGKGWWTGVDSGESGHWDLSLQVPPGMLSIRRTRLIEVQYTLRVTVNGSIYVDVPVQLINFLSIDPPPMPRDGPGLLNPPVSNKQPVPNGQSRDLQVTIGGTGGVYQQPKPSNSRPGAIRSSSEFSADSVVGAARASSTTLHIDALLQAGRLRAEAEAMGNLPPALSQTHSVIGKPRPLSLGSSYSISNRTDLHNLTHIRTKSNPSLKPKGARVMSCNSSSHHNDSQSIFSGETHDDENDHDQDVNAIESQEDKMRVAAKRALARQRSLAVIHRDIDKEKRELYGGEEPLSPGREPDTPLQGEFRPCHTPSEEVYEMVGNTPEEDTTEENQDPLPIESPKEDFQRRQLRVVNTDENDDLDNEDEADEAITQENDGVYGGLENVQDTTQETEDAKEEGLGLELDAGNETVLANMVPEERQELEQVMSEQGHEDNVYDYGEDAEIEDDEDDQEYLLSPAKNVEQVPSSISSQRLPFGSEPYQEEPDRDRESHIAATRSVYGSFAAGSAVSEQESEIGQVYEVVKRNISIKVPSKLIPLSSSSDEKEERGISSSPTESLKDIQINPSSAPLTKSSSISHSLLADARRASSSQFRKDSMSSINFSPGTTARRGSSILAQPQGNTGAMSRRESSTMGTAGHGQLSPMRREGSSGTIATSPIAVARVLQKKNSFTFAAPGSPLRIKTSSSVLSTSPEKESRIRSSPSMSPKSLSPVHRSMDMMKLPSMNSQLRNQILPSESDTNSRSSADKRSPDLNGDSGDEGGFGLPGLAPSVASDSASSSEGHQSDSPISLSSLPQPHIQSHSPNPTSPTKRLLPLVPGVYQPFSMDQDVYQPQQKEMLGNPDWRPEGCTRNSQVLHVRTQVYPQSERQNSLPIPMEEEMAYSEENENIPSSPRSTSSCHSILPSVKNKILQLENRDEALRKFSVSGSVPSSAVPSRQASIVSPELMMSSRHDSLVPMSSRQNSLIPNTVLSSRQGSIVNPNIMSSRQNNLIPGMSTIKETTTTMTSPTVKRKSYTTALAPKPSPQRKTSNESYHSAVPASPESSVNTPIGYRYDQPSYQVQVQNIKGLGHTTYVNRRSYGSPTQTHKEGDYFNYKYRMNGQSHAHGRSDSINSNTRSATSSKVSPLNESQPVLDPFGLNDNQTEPLGEVEVKEMTVKTKVSGFWQIGDDNGDGENSKSDLKVFIRHDRVSVSEGETSESEGLL
ncbi:hypothetical protein I203_106246 [Kwoniella mangroviensis CBS 8507]|uniref:uncharacterized protein n=1 Tax=Kwoniella mangroviensis CBS 8507 TaxID=1296122 RepID=UPI00080D545D|nr:uncharacterized protein I203_04720 [Kwoniella mangroviensis CBS 8507]OCF66387.1 hypothetical protein I203_04720 [Kwoniella mangroviensis CBS 8507]